MRLPHLLILVGIVAACLWVATGHGLVPGGSLFRQATGEEGPTGGLTRAVGLALRGEWSAAADVHPSAPWVVGWCALQIGWRALCLGIPGWSRWWPWDLALSLATFAAAVHLPWMLS